MRNLSLKISVYVVQSIFPYFLSAWILLTVVLFVQQAGRYADIFFNPNLPNFLLWQLTFALLPSVISFTCPMAILVGVLIGIGKMHSDRETIAIKASGASYAQIVLPIVVLGFFLSLFAFFINWKAVPAASKIVRQVALKTALAKLASPLEPGSLSTDIPNLTVYVREGDLNQNAWQGIIVFRETPSEKAITIANEGYMSVPDDYVEFVLKDAWVISFPKEAIAFEKSESVRVAVKTKKAELEERLKKTEESLEELGLEELYKATLQRDGKDKLEAQILFNRRIVLSTAPLIFAFLGAVLGARLKRHSRGNGIFVSLLILIIFYLVGLLGEQMARTGQVSPTVGSFMPISTIPLILMLALAADKPMDSLKSGFLKAFRKAFTRKTESGSFLVLKFPRLSDLDLARGLLKFYILACLFLLTTYLVFTAFELWKFAGAMTNGTKLLIQYLVYLLPYVYLQISPSCMMIACLAAVTIKSRQNELITLTASGQSIYRVVLLPCVLIGLVVGIVNWVIQEKVAPEANKRQDVLRTTIRQRGVTTVNVGSRIWAIADNRLLSLKAYDREKGQGSDFYLFEFDGNKVKSILTSKEVLLSSESESFCNIEPLKPANKLLLLEGTVKTDSWVESILVEDLEPEMLGTQLKPSYMTAAEIAERIKNSDISLKISDSEQRLYITALEKRYSSVLLPLIAIIVATSFSLKTYKSMAGIGYSVALWVAFIGASNLMEQMALSGWIQPKVAVWAPLILFCAVGIYLLSKAKT
ncbi:MAG: YjgP/YjgQ family permease [Acidobacteria bacterium]|jgi:lipopolysaccharide export LptBFGC system permease protein LptF|nr:MAG: YjgP/YjgQ family permease [Acidobacteriota bacterium]GIU81146.1 MAG: hypothetical protein KatS3mg006_0210 [Pyrinomonadaceae bacterium]